ncbi:hypothetical protein SHI21_06505 [Bacteriovorax sp. PP10]|uniref:SHSP domain-containing protein n=1 Tax=Bacteriovorax antarcticus TaxID=3088717 RepID=A0ABU5VS03_9BACT|nr:hypothetical protein [Bacteriovorax sp. PP10]MEA9355841.1 hypothetical protein [Bacteriovorax sp. PP10]
MKRLLNTKLFIAVIFFCIGFFTNHLLTKVRGAPMIATNDERFPVDIDDFDHTSMMDTINRLSKERAEARASAMGDVSKREDDDNVYYDIPQKTINGVEHRLNVEVKDGMIKISEDQKSSGDTLVETSSERMFSIDPGLDGDKAEVINEKDKIVIKIPKK